MNKQRLIEDNINLVYYVIKKYYPNYLYDEDIVQEGMVGLCKAVNAYDSDKSKFSTFAARCILNQIKYYFRKNSKHYDVLSYDRVIENIEDESITFLDMICGEEDVGLGVINFKMFYEKLSENEQEFVDLLATHTEREIGEILGMAQGSVSRRKTIIKKKWWKFNGKDKD